MFILQNNAVVIFNSFLWLGDLHLWFSFPWVVLELLAQCMAALYVFVWPDVAIAASKSKRSGKWHFHNCNVYFQGNWPCRRWSTVGVLWNLSLFYIFSYKKKAASTLSCSLEGVNICMSSSLILKIVILGATWFSDWDCKKRTTIW